MAPFPMTLTNCNPVFKVTPIFDAKYLTNGYRYSNIYIFIRQKGSSNKWKKHQTHKKNKQTKEREKTTLKSGRLVNSVTTNEL